MRAVLRNPHLRGRVGFLLAFITLKVYTQLFFADIFLHAIRRILEENFRLEIRINKINLWSFTLKKLQ